jgi:anti-anti-sigma factor
MDIQEVRKGAVTVIKPNGALVGDDADRLKRAVSTAGGANLGRVVLDAAGIPFVDSRGLEALLDLSDELGQGGRSLKLSGATAAVREALDLTGVAESLEFYDDPEAAVRSFL